MKKQALDDQIEIYIPKDQTKGVQVKLAQETVWLSLDQMSQLFDRDKNVISKHLKSIFNSNELNKKSVVTKSATTASDGKIYQVDFYNLEVIISVGYRVNFTQAVAFRIWATEILKNYISNEKPLKESTTKLQSLKDFMDFIQKPYQKYKLSLDESKEILKTITDYSYTFDILDAYDHKNLTLQGVSSQKTASISYKEALQVISKVKAEFINKNQASKLFGEERSKGLLDSCLKTIYQTFEGKDLYPSIEEKAAHLLYLIVKNHPFIDGNKRIGAFLFILFLRLNQLLSSKEGQKGITDNTLIPLTLFIAESKPQDKDIIIRLIVNLINNRSK